MASQAIETATGLPIFGILPTEREAGVPYQQIVASNMALKGGPTVYSKDKCRVMSHEIPTWHLGVGIKLRL